MLNPVSLVLDPVLIILVGVLLDQLVLVQAAGFHLLMTVKAWRFIAHAFVLIITFFVITDFLKKPSLLLDFFRGPHLLVILLWLPFVANYGRGCQSFNHDIDYGFSKLLRFVFIGDLLQCKLVKAITLWRSLIAKLLLFTFYDILHCCVLVIR